MIYIHSYFYESVLHYESEGFSYNQIVMLAVVMRVLVAFTLQRNISSTWVGLSWFYEYMEQQFEQTLGCMYIVGTFFSMFSEWKAVSSLHFRG